MWSGERSHSVARALKDFLEFVVRGPKYVISDDLEAGQLWRHALATSLHEADFGIACLTSDALRSHWLHFEAGALSKAFGKAHVVPLLAGPTTSDVDGPLADFQMLVADRAGIARLVSLLSSKVPISAASVVDKSFAVAWPDLEQQLAGAAAVSIVAAAPERDDGAVIREVLDRVRRLESREGARPERSPKTYADAEMLEAMKGPLLKLLDYLDTEPTTDSMDQAILQWRKAVASSALTADELLQIYQSARGMEAYLNR